MPIQLLRIAVLFCVLLSAFFSNAKANDLEDTLTTTAFSYSITTDGGTFSDQASNKDTTLKRNVDTISTAGLREASYSLDIDLANRVLLDQNALKASASISYDLRDGVGELDDGLEFQIGDPPQKWQRLTASGESAALFEKDLRVDRPEGFKGDRGQIKFNWKIDGRSQLNLGNLNLFSGGGTRVNEYKAFASLQYVGDVIADDFHENKLTPKVYNDMSLTQANEEDLVGSELSFDLEFTEGKNFILLASLVTGFEIDIVSAGSAGANGSLQSDFFNTATLESVVLTDVNGNLIQDATIIDNATGRPFLVTAAVPEPSATACLLLMGLCAGIKRRRA